MAPAPLRSDDAVHAVYSAHGPELFRCAQRSLGDRGLAEEAVQETFVRAWQAAHRFDDQIASLRTWLFAILRNVVIDMARARQSRLRLIDTDGEASLRSVLDLRDDAIDQMLSAWQVEEALRNVSQEHRYVLVEIQSKGRLYEDVPRELGVPVGTVKSRVYYGLKAMRLAMEELGYLDVD